jgi:hypothetical protein
MARVLVVIVMSFVFAVNDRALIRGGLMAASRAVSGCVRLVIVSRPMIHFSTPLMLSASGWAATALGHLEISPFWTLPLGKAESDQHPGRRVGRLFEVPIGPIAKSFAMSIPCLMLLPMMMDALLWGFDHRDCSLAPPLRPPFGRDSAFPARQACCEEMQWLKFRAPASPTGSNRRQASSGYGSGDCASEYPLAW